MKIRIKGNSVRFRLTQTEVKHFCEKGYIGEQTHFNGSIFSYGVELSEHTDQLMAEFTGDAIILKVPKKMGNGWDGNDQVGFQNTMALANGDELFLLLEKDFIYKDSTLGDQTDNYPNPKIENPE